VAGRQRRGLRNARRTGRWTHADLQARIDEPWFDAAGFLLTNVRVLLGYHWTKVHATASARCTCWHRTAGQGLGSRAAC